MIAASPRRERKASRGSPCAVEPQRAPARERAQENLQSAIAADVVEGRPLLQRRFHDRAHQRVQSVRDELGRPRRARGRQYPFRPMNRGARRAQRLQRQPADRREFDLDRRGLAVMHDRVGFGVAHDARQRFRPPARRAEHDAARHPVEIDQRRGGQSHVAHKQDNRAALQPPETVAEARARREIVERETMIARLDDAPSHLPPLDQMRQMHRPRRAIGLRQARPHRRR